MLPKQAWDRLVLLRSSPGTGKTSLMRLFTPEHLEWVRSRLSSAEPLRKALLEIGAIEESRARKLGVLIELDRDYRSLMDLPLSTSVGRKLFLRLLDVRVLVGILRGALVLTGRSFPLDVGELRFRAGIGSKCEAVLETLGGPTGDGILEYARVTERAILRLLDALVASDVDDVPSGHNELYSLTLLSGSTISVAKDDICAQPLLMFDDGHRLDRTQRDALLDELRRRTPVVGRWYSERYEALSDQELLAGAGQEGRDVELVDLDSMAREGSSEDRRFTRGRYERLLRDIAMRRAEHQLTLYAHEDQEFLQLLSEDHDEAFSDVAEKALSILEKRVLDLGARNKRYSTWVEQARRSRGFEAAVKWRELEVLIHRDQDRQLDLFESVLPLEELAARSSPAIREACVLSVAEEFRLPYFKGSGIALALASYNAQQFLNICGNLFAEMLVDVSLGRPPMLSAKRQHRVLRDASEQYWESIPRTVPRGRDVQALVGEIVEIARIENKKPRVPYPPGVTGTAMLMAERKQLLDPDYRRRTPGSERLFSALASAVANNVMSAQLDYSVKGSRYMVLYLNRLLCPRFGLPLGYGGFRERRLHVLLGWMHKQPAEPLDGEQLAVPGELLL